MTLYDVKIKYEGTVKIKVQAANKGLAMVIAKYEYDYSQTPASRPMGKELTIEEITPK